MVPMGIKKLLLTPKNYMGKGRKSTKRGGKW